MGTQRGRGWKSVCPCACLSKLRVNVGGMVIWQMRGLQSSCLVTDASTKETRPCSPVFLWPFTYGWFVCLAKRGQLGVTKELHNCKRVPPAQFRGIRVCISPGAWSVWKNCCLKRDMAVVVYDGSVCHHETLIRSSILYHWNTAILVYFDNIKVWSFVNKGMNNKQWACERMNKQLMSCHDQSQTRWIINIARANEKKWLKHYHDQSSLIRGMNIEWQARVTQT